MHVVTLALQRPRTLPKKPQSISCSASLQVSAPLARTAAHDVDDAHLTQSLAIDGFPPIADTQTECHTSPPGRQDTVVNSSLILTRFLLGFLGSSDTITALCTQRRRLRSGRPTLGHRACRSVPTRFCSYLGSSPPPTSGTNLSLFFLQLPSAVHVLTLALQRPRTLAKKLHSMCASEKLQAAAPSPATSAQVVDDAHVTQAIDGFHPIAEMEIRRAPQITPRKTSLAR